MLESKHSVAEMKNAFGGVVSKSATAEEGISEFENIKLENWKAKRRKTERKKENTLGRGDGYSS